MPPHYLHLDLPKHGMRIASRFRLRAHTLAMESSIWRGGNGHCDKCSCAAVQNEVHFHSHCQTDFVCALSEKKYSVPTAAAHVKLAAVSHSFWYTSCGTRKETLLANKQSASSSLRNVNSFSLEAPACCATHMEHTHA